MSSLEDHIYETIPADHNEDELKKLIQQARRARQSGDTTAYKDAVVDLLNAHLESFKDFEAYSPYDYKSDGFLSTKEVAMINARFRNKTRQGAQAKSIETAFNEQITEYRSKLPDIRPLYSGLGGTWDIKGAKADATDIFNENVTALTTSLNAQPTEAAYIARLQVMKTLKLRTSDQKHASMKVIDSTTGNTITVHMNVDGSGVLTPKATREDFIAAVAGISAVRAGGFYRGKVNLHLMDNNSAIPKDIENQINADTVAFTFDGANAIRVYVDKVHDQVAAAQANPGYWSTDITDASSSMKHFVAHEIIHQIADEVYGSGRAKSLSDDMRKFFDEETNAPETPSVDAPIDNTVGSHVERIVDSQKSSEDLTSWKQIGGQQGSNDGGTFQDPTTGKEIYAKFPQTQLHGENERLASALYQAMGIGSTNIVSGTVAGRSATYSEMIPGVRTDFDSKVRTDPAYLKKVQDGFAADALLANWDVVLNDNIVTDANGDPIRIDPGGALLFRARGDAKGSAFGDSVLELDTFTQPNNALGNGKTVGLFGKMSEADKKESAKHVQALKPAEIDALVDSIITDKASANQLKDTLKKRRAYILKKFGLDDSTDNTASKARAKAHAASNNAIPAASTRGSASDAENFAELGAKYVLTGEAPDWFVKMLEARGIAKAKISKAWRQHLDNIKTGFLGFIDKIIHENDNGMYPETNKTLYAGPDDYGSTAILGAAGAHRLARLNGVRDNTPQLVDDFTPGWNTMFRGVGGSNINGTYKSARELHREFATTTDPYYSFQGMTAYGDGIYGSANKSDADDFGSRSNSRDTQSLEMAVDPNARIYVDHDKKTTKLGIPKDPNQMETPQIQEAVEELIRSLIVNEQHPELDENSIEVRLKARDMYDALPLTSSSGNSHTNLAFLAGYDAVEFGNGYIVILNRGILQVRKRDIA